MAASNERIGVLAAETVKIAEKFPLFGNPDASGALSGSRQVFLYKGNPTRPVEVLAINGGAQGLAGSGVGKVQLEKVPYTFDEKTRERLKREGIDPTATRLTLSGVESTGVVVNKLGREETKVWKVEHTFIPGEAPKTQTLGFEGQDLRSGEALARQVLTNIADRLS